MDWVNAQHFCENLQATVPYSEKNLENIKASSSFWRNCENAVCVQNPNQADPNTEVSETDNYTVVCQKQKDVLHPKKCDTDNGWLMNELGCFKKPNITLDWLLAQQFCQAQGAELAEIKNQCQNNFLVSLLSGEEGWIGLYYHQEPIWSSGSHVIYSNVDESFEDTRLPGADYFFFLNNNGKWYPSSYLKGDTLDQKKFICQKSLFGQRYFIYEEKVTWKDAKSKCYMRGKMLAEILNHKDQEEVEALKQDGWIGLKINKDNNPVWNSNNDYQYTKLSDKKKPSCIMTSVSGNTWEPKNCEEKNHYICQKKSFSPPEPEMVPSLCDNYHQGNCYTVLKYPVNEAKAHEKCHELNMELVSILSANEQKYVANLTDSSRNYWLGARLVHSDVFMWTDGNGLFNASWHSANPNELDTEHCVKMLRGNIHNIYCSLQAYPICKRRAQVNTVVTCEKEWFKFADFCYKYHQNNQTFQNAEHQCKKDGAHILSILSKKEGDFISAFTNETSIWLGITTQNGQWFWIDSQRFSYTLINPDVQLEVGDCFVRNNSGWHKSNCSQVKTSVCKKPARQSCDLHWNGACYFIHKDKQTQSNAKRRCKAYHSELVSIHSDEEFQFLKKSFDSKCKYFWIGAEMLKFTDKFYWNDGTGFVTWNNWKSGQPDNADGIEFFGATEAGGWFDYNGKNSVCFICKWRPDTLMVHCETGWLKFNNTCFFINQDEKLSMRDAEMDCISRDSELASLNSHRESNFIKSFAKPGFLYWLGLKNLNGTWFWINGESVEENISISATAGSPCGYMASDGSFKDEDCNQKMNYICTKRSDSKMSISISSVTNQLMDPLKWYDVQGQRIYLNINVTWEHAVMICQDLGCQVVKYKNNVEKLKMIQNTEFWTDLKYSNNKITWSYGSQTTNVNWALLPTEGCGYFTKCGIQVIDCNTKHNLMCIKKDVYSNRWKNISGMFIYQSSFEMEFKNAEKFCAAAGNALLTTLSNDCMYSELFVDDRPVFVGHKKVNKYFKPGLPSLQEYRNLNHPVPADDLNCTLLHSNGSWESVSCESKHRFSCLKYHKNYAIPNPCGRCPWKAFGEKCFISIEAQLTWKDSRQTCQDYNGRLVRVDSNQTLSFILSLSFSKRFWVGNSSRSQNKCPRILNENHEGTTNCDDKASFVCERSVDTTQSIYTDCKPPWKIYGKSCYLFSTTQTTWRGALSICHGFQGSLASIGSEGENSYIKRNTNQWIFYIGLNNIFNEDAFVWTDGTTYEYTKLQNKISDKRCATIAKNGEWSLDTCEHPHLFICKKRYDNNITTTVLPSSTPFVSSTSLIISTTKLLAENITKSSTTEVQPFSSAHPTAVIHSTKWSNWQPWQPCDTLCGYGNEIRSRSCISSNPAVCVGKDKEQRECQGAGDCSNYIVSKGGFSCTSYCSNQGKVCDPLMQTGGTVELFILLGYKCSADRSQKDWNVPYAPFFANETDTCNGYDNLPKQLDCAAVPISSTHVRLCKCIDKGNEQMLPWSPWSACSATCDGQRTRERFCALNVDPDLTCLGSTKQSESCNSKCPVHAGFTVWSKWSDCSLTCGGGYQKRTRNCSNPLPLHGGLNCVGPVIEKKTCAVENCPIHGEWSRWSDPSACTKPCDKGYFVKRRYCNNPRPMYGGRYCEGSWNETEPCNDFRCQEVDVDVYCKFQMQFLRAYKYSISREWKQFQKDLFMQLQVSIDHTFPGDITAVKLLQLKNGSVDAYFRVTFNSLESYQLVYLQDSIEKDLVIGKFPIKYGSSWSYKTINVPTGPPTNIVIVSSSPTSLNISWSKVDQNSTNGNVTGYLVFYQEHLLMSDRYSVLASYGFWEDVTGLKPGTSYVVRVLAYNNNGNGVASNLIEASTIEMAPTSPPTNIDTKAANEASIFVQWSGVSLEDINGEPLGYRIYCSDTLNNTLQIKTVPFTKPYLILSGLSPSTTYIISVAAYNKAGEGPHERTAATTNPAAPTLPPTALIVTYRSHNKLILNWTSDSPDYDGYILQYRIIHQNSKAIIESVLYERKYPAAVLSEILINVETNTKYMFNLAGYNLYGNGPSISITAETCKCPERFYTNYYIKPPYVIRTSTHKTGDLNGIFPLIVKDMIKNVCGSCSTLYSESVVDFAGNGKFGFAGKQNLDRVVEDIDNFTDISFPMSTNPIEENTLKAEFIPIISYPGAIFIIKEETLSDRVRDMIFKILGIWTILLVDTLFILIAGGIVWFLEKWANRQDDFSLFGGQGVKEGFYWAYVTQTTLGYGDFTPKSIRARLFAVVWMIISTITWSLLTGALTTAFTGVEMNEVDTIYGVQVAALYGSIEERIAVLRNGKLDKNTKYTSVQQLFDALLSGDTSGILLDAYSAGREKKYLESYPLRAIFSIKYPRTFGVVVTADLANLKTDMEAYVIANQELIIKTLEEHTHKMAPKRKKKKLSLFSPESIFLQNAIIVLSICLFVAMLLGHAVSCRRRKSKRITIYPKETVKSMLWKLDLDSLRKFSKVFQLSYMQKINDLYKRIELERIKLFYDRGASSLRVHDKQIEERYKKRERGKRMKRKRKVGRVAPGIPVLIESDNDDVIYRPPTRKLTYTIKEHLRLRKISRDNDKGFVKVWADNVPLTNIGQNSSIETRKEKENARKKHKGKRVETLSQMHLKAVGEIEQRCLSTADLYEVMSELDEMHRDQSDSEKNTKETKKSLKQLDTLNSNTKQIKKTKKKPWR